MKFLIVVLAVASLCLAEPEADPSFLYAAGYPYVAAYPYAAAYYVRPAIANGYGYNYPGGYTHVNRLDKREAEPEADPALLYAATPYVAAPYVASPYVAAPYAWPYAYAAYGPRDCVTAEGCAVQNLRHFGKREAEADASVLYANTYAYNAYPYAAYPYATYPYAYNPYYAARVAQVAPVVATINKPVTYTHLGAHPIHDTTVVEQHSAIVGHALVKREAEAEADASVLYANTYAYNAYPYAAYPYAAYPYAYNPYYAPRVAHVAPVVATINKPVTYTHLGAHPIHDTTVVEQHSAVVGHAVVV